MSKPFCKLDKKEMIDQVMDRADQINGYLWKVRNIYKFCPITKRDLSIVNRRLALIATKLNFKLKD